VSLLDRWDPLDSITSVWGSSEFDWFNRTVEAIFGYEDPYGTGPIPMPRPVPVVISETPQTWEELEQLDPELFEPILETRPGRTPDPYPQDVANSIEPEDEVANTWGDWFFDTTTGIIGDYLNPQPQPMGFAQYPSTPENQAATAAAIGGGGMNGANCDGMTWAGGAPPKGYKVVRDSCGNGVLRKVRRRRRRRMLTASDKTDIASIVSMVGKGQLAASLINRSAS